MSKETELEERVAVLENLCLLLLFGSITAPDSDVTKAAHGGLGGQILAELSKTRFRGSVERQESPEKLVRRFVGESETEKVKA